MPLVRIELMEGNSEDQVRTIGEAVHLAMRETLDVPERDRFQIVSEHPKGHLIYDPGYLGVQRTDGLVLIQVFLSSGRTTGQKQAFYERLAELVEEKTQTRPEDIMVVLVENDREDWSFGGGEAPYLTLPKDQWK